MLLSLHKLIYRAAAGKLRRGLFFLFPIDWDLEHSPVRTGDTFPLYSYVRAKNVCLRLVCLHVAFPIFAT